MTFLDEQARLTLCRRRIELGWSQVELAGRMGTSQGALSSLESGGHDPRQSTLHRWAGALGLLPRVVFDEIEQNTGAAA